MDFTPYERNGRSGLLSASLAATALMVGASQQAQGSGFALIEQSGSGVGMAFAGIAASADDVSAMFFNPASMALLEGPQLTVAVHGIDLRTEFSNNASTLPPAGLGLLSQGATRNDAGGFAPVPNAYVSWPINDGITVGLGVTAPFGLKTEYDDPWVGRFQGILSELVTVNANPAVSFRVNERLVLGAGINYQRADVELTNAVLLGPATEGRARVEVDDDAWGWNIGALLTLPAGMRIGASYRSRIDYDLLGQTTVRTLAGDVVAAASGSTAARLIMPDGAHVSFAQPVGAEVEIRADMQWTNWSEVQTLVAQDPSSGMPRDVLQLRFKDSWRFAIGSQYRWTDRWTFRTGLAWDGTPVSDEFRTVRLPDQNRWWVALGARWLATERLHFDLAYARLFVKEPKVALTREQPGAPPSFASTVVGAYDSAVGIYSAQLNSSFR